MRQSGGFLTIVIVLAVIAGFGYLIWSNASSADSLRVLVPTEPQPTEISQSWQELLQAGSAQGGSAVPTIVIPDQTYVPPTIPQSNLPTMTPLPADQVRTGGELAVAVGATPTLPPPTIESFGRDSSSVDGSGAAGVPGGQTLEDIPTRIVPTDQPVPTNPPSIEVPIQRHPFDHYWFRRPIDAQYQNFGLRYYEYGTNGPADDPYPIHHGVDMPNRVGTPVRAGGDGTVIWVSNPDDDERSVFQGSPSYGNVIVIEHDFSYRGQTLWTLYAHLEDMLVEEGQFVRAGDAIALLGNTGRSTGPHVQFEVRVGSNDYGSTYNPVLWMAPYVGHGTIAGRVVDSRGNFLDDTDVTLMTGGLTVASTTTYVFRGVGSEVNFDPNWQENFVFADVPVGRYQVVMTLNGQRVIEIIDVREGMTSFVELKPEGAETEIEAP